MQLHSGPDNNTVEKSTKYHRIYCGFDVIIVNLQPSFASAPFVPGGALHY